MSRELLYTFADRDFYERIDRYNAGSEFRTIVEDLVPPDWRLSRGSIWMYASKPNDEIPSQGFKIHVSSVPQHAMPVLKIAVQECVRHATGFKCVADTKLLRLQSSKPYDPGGSGKFITIYPADMQTFRDLLAALYHRTVGGAYRGPYILSDRRYRDSNILYYRYGGMRPAERLAVDGVKYGMLTAPNGSTVRDYRYPFFKLPDWIDDPFGGTHELTFDPKHLIGGQFRIERMRGFSNRGGIYDATDTLSGDGVIVKEARPHIHEINLNDTVLHSTTLLDREYATLQRLRHLACTPNPICLLAEWEHHFLVQEKVDGIQIREFFGDEDRFLLPYIHRDGRLDDFLAAFRTVAPNLLDAVEGIHGERTIIGDLSHGNVLVDRNGTRVWLIDLETATTLDDDPALVRLASEWYTPGYSRPDRARSGTVTFEDDFYALAIVLLSTFFGGPAYLPLEPRALPRLMRGIVDWGIPQSVGNAILALADGKAAEARRLLRQL